MNRSERRSIAKAVYNELKGVDNTVILFYSSPQFPRFEESGEIMGATFVLDRDSLMIKKEDFAVVSSIAFADFANNIFESAEIASNYKKVRFSCITIDANLTADETDVDMDIDFMCFGDNNLKEDFKEKYLEIFQDITNLVNLSGNSSL